MKTIMIAALVGAGVLLLMAVVLALLRPKAPVAQSPTATPQATAPIAQSPVQPYAPSQPLAQTDVPPAPPAAKAPVEEKAPPEVIKYLEFVKQIDRERMNTKISFMDILNNPKQAGSIFQDYVTKCNQLAAKFRAVDAPEPCIGLKGAYDRALSNYVIVVAGMQGDIIKMIGSASHSYETEEELIEALSTSPAKQAGVPLAMKDKYGNSQPDIDEGFRRADQELDKVTKRYKLEKSFTISPDREVESILGQ